MLLFFISFLLTLITGFFISSVFERNNFIKIFIYCCLAMFAATVLNVEILSLFSKISTFGILSLNVLFAVVSGIFWYKKGKPLYKIKCKRFFKRLYYAVVSDKYLLVLGLSFLFMCAVSLFLVVVMPIVNADAETYHVLRSLFWIDNGTLNHFDIGDARNLVMPINSEILYLWLLIFLKKQICLGIYGFIGFLLSIISLYGILGKIRISERHKLWTIFILASLPSVIVQVSGTETDIIISGLVLASIYLYWNSMKTKNISELYFASLAYALAIGTKTTSLMLMFPVGVWMLWIGYKYLKQDFYKPFLKFIGFGIINFIIFSSYNYILNVIDYGSLFGPLHFQEVHKNLFGIKGAVAGFIKHVFLFFDFTGYTWDQTLGIQVFKLKTHILQMLNLSYVSDGIMNMNNDKFNRTLLEPLMGMGILGFLIYLPCWIYSLIKPIFTKKENTRFICSFGLILLGAIIVMSYSITYMVFSIRFLTSFCVVAAPILIYSYTRKNNIPKFIITYFALFGLLVVSTHLFARPFFRIVNYLTHGFNIHETRYQARCSLFSKHVSKPTNIINEMCEVEKLIRQQGKDKKILYIPNKSENLLPIKMLDFEGYDIDYILLYKHEDFDFDKYDVFIIKNYLQEAANYKNNTTPEVFSPSSGVVCKDFYPLKDINLPNKERILNNTVCIAYEPFYKDHHFYLIKTFPFVEGGKEDNVIQHYYVFIKNAE